MEKEAIQKISLLFIFLVGLTTATAFGLYDITGEVISSKAKTIPELTEEETFFLEMANIPLTNAIKYKRYDDLITRVEDDGYSNHTIYSYQKNKRGDMEDIGYHTQNYASKDQGRLLKASEGWHELNRVKRIQKSGVTYGDLDEGPQRINQSITYKEKNGDSKKIIIPIKVIDLKAGDSRNNIKELFLGLKTIREREVEKSQKRELSKFMAEEKRVIRRDNANDEYGLENVRIENGSLISYDIVFDQKGLFHRYSFEAPHTLVSLSEN